MKKQNPSPPGENISIQPLLFQAPNRKNVRAVFDEPEITSDAGLLLLMQHPSVAREIVAFADTLRDPRKRCEHSFCELISQRVFQILAGYEDANDCDIMRHDPLLKLAAGREADGDPLASQPTMTRFENGADIKDLLRLFYGQIDAFARAFRAEVKQPAAIVLDVDPSAHLTYGDQQLSLYNHHVGDYCLMPFYVYEGQTGLPVASVVRPGKTPSAAEIKALLKRLVKRLRRHFPELTIIFRADSHHTKPEIMDWCEDRQIEFVTGLGPNSRLKEQFGDTIGKARELYERYCARGQPDKVACVYSSGFYQAGSWCRPRRVICRVYHGPMGSDARYVVTGFHESSARYLYETVYCGRGAAELMIKEHKLGLGSDRSSCHSPLANQLRLGLHNLAYLIVHRFRSRVLKGTALAKASFARIRLELLKSGARVVVRKTYVALHLAAAHPMRNLWTALAPRCATLRECDSG